MSSITVRSASTRRGRMGIPPATAFANIRKPKLITRINTERVSIKKSGDKIGLGISKLINKLKYLVARTRKAVQSRNTKTVIEKKKGYTTSVGTI